MPAIHLFGKRTILGGDDLHVPALATVVVRLIQLSLLIVPLSVYLWKQAIFTDHRGGSSNNGNGYDFPLWKYLFDWWNEMDNNGANDEEPPACTKSYFSRYYPLLSALHLASSALFCFHSLSLEYRIWHWSCQGTPTMRQPRTMKVQELLERKLGICTVLLALIVASTYFFAATCFARPYHKCYIHAYLYQNGDNNDDTMQDDAIEDVDGDSTIDYWVGSRTWYFVGALLAVSQTVEVILAALFYTRLMRPSNDVPGVEPLTDSGETALAIAHTSSSHHHGVHHELIEEQWADRCQSLFRCLSISTCFLFGGHDLMDNARSNNSYRHVAQALADYLETKGTLDVVPTDLFTGLLVLQRIQRQRILETRRIVYEESSSMLISRVRLENGRGGFGTEANGPSAPTITEVYEQTTNEYHAITSPDISQTGLRSRVASTNDLRGRTITSSSRSPSPNSMRQTTFSTPNRNSKPPPAPTSAPQMMDHPGSTTMAMMNSPTRINQTTALSISGSSSSLPSEIRAQHDPYHPQSQRNIYRRRHPSSSTAIGAGDIDLLLQPNNSSDGGSFYRATSRKILNPCDPVDTGTLEEGARMCDYALSIYTWMLYVFVHPVTGFPRLICQCGSGDGSITGCCKSCCCKVCSILQQRQNSSASSPASVSMPLRRQRRTGPENGSYDTSQQGQILFPSSTPSHRSRGPSRVNSNSSHHSEDDSMQSEVYEDEPYEDCAHHRTAGDNICEWHKRALLLVAGIPNADLVYAQFNNRLSSVPYCILMDHERSLVVLSIRGSLSLEDVVTDTLVLPESLEDIGERYGFDGRGQYCHAGVLACFENVLRDLHRHGWLERLLEREYPDYSLRIVGHSLGAGVCTLLGYVLRSKYPSLKVFGFSPPGCTMTWELATKCDEWSTSFVLDSDIVPRLSVLALEDLRDEVLELIGRIKVPKYKVFENFLKGRDGRKSCLYGSDGRNDNSDQTYYNDDLEELTEIINDTLYDVPPDTIYQRQLRDFLRVQAERKEARGDTNSRRLRLYPPGKMIHLLKTGEEGGCAHLVNKCLTCCTSNSGFLYTPVYISNDDLDEIVVNATMGTDHFIDRMCDELHKISNDYSEKYGIKETADQNSLGNEIV